MIHQPLAGMQGTAEDIAIHMREFKRTKARLNEILIKHAVKIWPRSKRIPIEIALWIPMKAVAYGLIDRVVESMPRRRGT